MPRSAMTQPPTDPKVLDALTRVGTDDPVFGGEVDPNGYFMQQRPIELAQFIAVLNDFGSHRNLLEIGSASGGTIRAICDHVDVGDIVVLDDGEHWNHKHWVRNALKVRTTKGQVPRLVVTDSHSAHARQVAMTWRPYDLILIDGDHSYDGLYQDIDLALDVVAKSGLIALHDIVAMECDDVTRIHGELRAGSRKQLTHLCDIIADDEPQFGWGVFQHCDNS